MVLGIQWDGKQHDRHDSLKLHSLTSISPTPPYAEKQVYIYIHSPNLGHMQHWLWNRSQQEEYMAYEKYLLNPTDSDRCNTNSTKIWTISCNSHLCHIPSPNPPWPYKCGSSTSWTSGGSRCTCPESPQARFLPPLTASDRSGDQHESCQRLSDTELALSDGAEAVTFARCQLDERLLSCSSFEIASSVLPSMSRSVAKLMVASSS